MGLGRGPVAHRLHATDKAAFDDEFAVYWGGKWFGTWGGSLSAEIGFADITVEPADWPQYLRAPPGHFLAHSPGRQFAALCWRFARLETPSHPRCAPFE